MDLPNLLSKITNTQQESKKFIAVEIGLDSVKAAIWQSDGRHTEVLSTGSIQIWTDGNLEELITAVDTSLADAQGSLTEEIRQVIFGLPDAWVNQDSTIVDDKKPILKTICKQFDFHPIGFVITTVAVTHHLRDTEGGAASYILVQLAANQLAISLVINGRLESTQVVDRSTNLAVDIEEALGKIPQQDNFPPRIIYLANHQDVDVVKQELVAYDWQKKLAFLHLPKVESLAKDWSIRAICISGGSEVIQSIGIKSEPKVEKPPVIVPTTNLGFKKIDLEQVLPPPTPPVSEIDNIEPATIQPMEPEPSPSSSRFHFPIKNIRLPKFKLPSMRLKLALPAILAIVVITGLAAAFILYRTIPSASIDVRIAMSPYQQQISFIIDPDIDSSDIEANILAGNTATVDVSGTKTITTTGTKLVGERAKGKVIIYNRTTAPKSLPAGTILRANNLRFTLDTSVTVASASSKENSDFSLTIEPSKTESTITAADIGAQYNLPKDTQFAVDNFASDTYFGITEAALSGGSSEKVSAVSAADMANLKSDLIQQLQQDLATQTASDSSEPTPGQIIVGEPEINQEEYSASLSQTASELSLTLSLSQSVYQYEAAELSVIALAAAQKSLAENVQIRPDRTQTKIISSKINDDDQAEITAQVIFYHIPRVETVDIATMLAGAKIDDISTKLSPVPGYQEHQITASKLLLLNRLPVQPSQISIRLIPVAKPELP